MRKICYACGGEGWLPSKPTPADCHYCNDTGHVWVSGPVLDLPSKPWTEADVQALDAPDARRLYVIAMGRDDLLLMRWCEARIRALRPARVPS